MSEAAAALFGDAAVADERRRPFEIDSAHQGEEGLAMVEQALRREPALPAGVRRRAHAARLGRRRNDPAHLGRWTRRS